jgi:hypothetical protein
VLHGDGRNPVGTRRGDGGPAKAARLGVEDDNIGVLAEEHRFDLEKRAHRPGELSQERVAE